MNLIANIVLICSLVLSVFNTESIAQNNYNRRGGGGKGRTASYNRMYNTNTVETLAGTIVLIERTAARAGSYCGIHLTVQSQDEEICVHLGPAWYFDSLDLTIVQNDTIEVTGSRITYEGSPAIIAASVEKAGQTVTLRDEIGVPVWSGWRRRK